MKKVFVKLLSSLLVLTMAFVSIVPANALEAAVEPRYATFDVIKNETIPVYSRDSNTVPIDHLNVKIVATMKEVNGSLSIDRYTASATSKTLPGNIRLSATVASGVKSKTVVSIVWRTTCQDYRGTHTVTLPQELYDFG